MGRTATFLMTGLLLGATPMLSGFAPVEGFAVVFALFATLPFAVLAAHAPSLPPRVVWTLHAGLTVAGVWIVLDLVTSTSSTAVLGMLWLPVVATVAAAALTLVLALAGWVRDPATAGRRS